MLVSDALEFRETRAWVSRRFSPSGKRSRRGEALHLAPQLRLGQGAERAPGPLAVVDLAEFLAVMYLETLARRDRGGGFLRAIDRRRVNGLELHSGANRSATASA